MVPKGNNGGQQVQNDRRVDEVDPFPYRVGDPIGARGRGGGGLRKGVGDFVFGEGDGGGNLFQQASAW